MTLWEYISIDLCFDITDKGRKDNHEKKWKLK
jgi:hypothetical protein